MKIAKTPPGGRWHWCKQSRAACLTTLKTRVSRFCLAGCFWRSVFGDNLAVIWLSWPTWINRSTNLFPTLPRGTNASLLPGLPPLQWVYSTAGHGKCETVSWKTSCFLTIIVLIPGQCCGQVDALLCRILRWTSVQRKLYLNLLITNTELCGQCAKMMCADEGLLKAIKQTYLQPISACGQICTAFGKGSYWGLALPMELWKRENRAAFCF